MEEGVGGSQKVPNVKSDTVAVPNVKHPLWLDLSKKADGDLEKALKISQETAVKENNGAEQKASEDAEINFDFTAYQE